MVEHANRYLASGGTDGHMYGAILAQPAIVKEAGERSSAVEKAGYDGLAEGAKVSFDVIANCGKESAENLKIG
jgi:CspA family cold shock protein